MHFDANLRDYYRQRLPSLDASLARMAEPLTVATVMGAVNLADELARRAVEGEQVEEHHPIIERAA